MIRDARNTFASAVSVAASAGTAVFGNYIDRTTTPNVDQARLYLQVWCTTAIITGTGNPNSNVSGGPTAGTLNQMYENLTATGDNDWLWRCSTGGTGGSGGTAVWIGKL